MGCNYLFIFVYLICFINLPKPLVVADIGGGSIEVGG
jgi:hypothetical protein